jgi:hypothetical protein
LLLLQYAACTYLFWLMLQRCSRPFALWIMVIFFLFFEPVFLLSLNCSNTSLVLGSIGCFGLLTLSVRNQGSAAFPKQWLVPAVLLLVSGMLRITGLGLCLVILLAFAIHILSLSAFRQLLLRLFPVCLLSGMLTFAQNLYYQANIPSSKTEERFRESLFYLANHPRNEEIQDTGITLVKNSFIRCWFFYDSGFVRQSDVRAYTRQRVTNRISYTRGLFPFLRVAFREHRVNGLLFLLVSCLFMRRRAYRSWFRWLRMVLTALLIFALLYIYFKITLDIVFTLLCCTFLSALLCHPNLYPCGRRWSYLFFALFCLNTAWAARLVFKQNERNEQRSRHTRDVLAELSGARRSVFLNTNIFADNGMFIWDLPLTYPLPNLLNKELLINGSLGPVFRRFNIKNVLVDAVTRNDIYLSGSNLPMLKEYYALRFGWQVQIERVPGFQYVDVYRIIRTH